MNLNYILISIEWIGTISLLLIFIPKYKIREAYIAFSFKQILTWILGLTVAQLRLIEYPIRLFPYASKADFTFEFFMYPSLCAIFNVHYPKNKGTFGQFMYYFYYCTTMTILEVFAERYTNILKYLHWAWYITWITLFMTFYITRKFYEWYLKINKD
jgi:hypothetical protein